MKSPQQLAVLIVSVVSLLNGSLLQAATVSQNYLFTTVAGTAPATGSSNGTNASFYFPAGIAVDSTGNTYVADTYNSVIRKIATNGVVSTVAGLALTPGSVNAKGTNARFSYPEGIAVDGSGNLYVADTDNETIRKIATNGVVSTVAGKAGISGSADGTNTTAYFNLPKAVAVDGSGYLYVADSGNNTIREIIPTVTTNNITNWVVFTIAGTAGSSGSSNGIGTNALFNSPQGIAVDSATNIYVGDSGNELLREMTFSLSNSLATNGSNITTNVITNWTVSTLAGTAGTAGSSDGVGTNALFNNPRGVAVDGATNLYVADTYNSILRKVAAGGVVTTLAGTAGVYGSANGTGTNASFSYPYGVAVDGSGNLYVADTFFNSIIRKVASNGLTATFAGYAGVTGSQDGSKVSPTFFQPLGVAVDGSGNTYVVDSGNHVIRMIAPNGLTATIAGAAGLVGNADGYGSSARFNLPQGIVYDGFASLYVADSGNNVIRKITPVGTNWSVSTLAGAVRGSLDGSGATARFNNPEGITMDGSGNLYVTDSGNETIRMVTAGGIVTTLAGAAGTAGSTNGTGTNALFNQPKGITLDGGGNLYVVDSGNNIIRKIGSGVVVTTLAGTPGAVGSADGTGTNASFNAPQGITVDGATNLYVSDSGNSTLRKITAGGVVTTIAGTAGAAGNVDGIGTNASFGSPAGVTLDAATNLYVADSEYNAIRQVSVGLNVTTLAGAGTNFGSSNGIGTNATFYQPLGVAVDAAGNAYVADTGNDVIRKFSITGVVTTVAGSAGTAGSSNGVGTNALFNQPFGITVDASTNLYVADRGNNTIRKITTGAVVTTVAGSAGTAGSSNGVGTNALFNQPEGISVDGATNLYVSDSGNNTIRMIASGAVVTTVAGSAGTAGSSNGVGTNALFNQPEGISVDGATNLYVSDSGNNTIRKIAPGAVVTTLAGTPGVAGSADGTGTNASFQTPMGVTTDGSGNLYVADSDNNIIRKIDTNAVVTTLGGVAGIAGSTDGTNTVARFFHPTGIAVYGSGKLYIVDSDNDVLRRGVIVLSPTKAQRVRFTSLPRQVYGVGMTNGIAKTIPLAATATSGLPVTFSCSDTNVATVSGTNLTILGAGYATVKASQSGNGTYQSAPDVHQVLIVSKGSQLITMAQISTNNLTYGSSIPLIATNSSGVPVTFTSSSTNVVISTNSVTTVTNGVSVTSNSAVINILGSGYTTITASAGNANYNTTSVHQVVIMNVAMGNQTISFTSPTNNTSTAFTNGGTIALTATASSGLPVTFVSGNSNVLTISGSMATMVGTGTATITATQGGNANYNAASPVTNTVTVTKGPQTISFNSPANNAALIYTNGGTFSLAATASSGLPVTNFISGNTNVLTISGTTATMQGTGTTTITATQAGNTNYNAATPVINAVSVANTQTISFTSPTNNTSLTFTNGSTFPLVATASSGLPVSFASGNTNVLTISGTNATFVGAGTTTITATQPGDTTNYYAATPVAHTVSVTKSLQTITFSSPTNNTSTTFTNGGTIALTATTSSGLSVTFASGNTNVLTISGSVATMIGAGTATITATQGGNANYNAATPVTNTVSVAPSAQTISFTSPTNNTSTAFTNGGIILLVATASSGQPVTFTSTNSSVLTITGNQATMLGTGTATITATQGGNTNYNAATPVTNTVTVTKGAQTISFTSPTNNTSLTFTNGATFPLVATSSAGTNLPVTFTSGNPSVFTISGTTATMHGTGTTTITASQGGDTNYNAATSVTNTVGLH